MKSVSSASCTDELGEAPGLHACHRKEDHRRPASPEQLQLASDTAEKLRKYRSRDTLLLLVIVTTLLAVAAGFTAWIWVDMKSFTRIQQELTAPPNWNEQRYLSKNPDVAVEVKRGHFTSGWQHYVIHGVDEGRSGVSIEALPAERK